MRRGVLVQQITYPFFALKREEGVVTALPGQLAFPELLDSYWVKTKGHAIIPDGTRFLIVEEREDGWLRGWRDGVRLPGQRVRGGTLLRPCLVERIIGDEEPIDVACKS